MARQHNLMMHVPSSSFVSFIHLLLAALVATAQNAPSQVRVGVILDLKSPVGHRPRTGIQMAVEDYYAAHPASATKVVLHFRDSEGDVLRAASAGNLSCLVASHFTIRLWDVLCLNLVDVLVVVLLACKNS
jgi:hypothetical protein